MKYEAWALKNLQVRSRFGDEALVMCPFHKNSTTPACSVNLRKGLYVCYSCGAKGHISDMAKRLAMLPFIETFPERTWGAAIRWLLEDQRVRTVIAERIGGATKTARRKS